MSAAETRPDTGAAFFACAECGKVGPASAMHYPGGDPENGPAHRRQAEPVPLAEARRARLGRPPGLRCPNCGDPTCFVLFTLGDGGRYCRECIGPQVVEVAYNIDSDDTGTYRVTLEKIGGTE